jgi:tetratricopeptide (TPR) repeat protein
MISAMTDSEPPPTVVFVSHSGADAGWAGWVADRLREAGYAVEIDQADWKPGEDFVRRMSAALERADVMVALWSAAYFNPDGYAIREWEAAFAARLRVVPLRIEDVTPPAMWRSVIYVNLFDVDEEQARRRLLNAVAGSSVLADGVSVSFSSRGSPVAHRAIAWNLPSRSLAFAGRGDLLAQVHATLQTGRSPNVLVLHGLSGVGKTHLALEYAHQFEPEYDDVWWVDAEQPSLIGEQLAAFAVAVGAATIGTDTPGAVEALKAELRGRDRWLIVFDNASSAADLAPWIPQGRGHVLITSRSHVWGGVAAAQPVGLFKRAESVAFLRAQRASITDVDAEKLASALGDLPLALAQAAGVMAETGMPPDEYLTSLSEAAGEVLAVGTPIGYPLSVAVAVRTSSARLGDEDLPASQLIRVCSRLGPEPIPIWMIAGAPAGLPAPLAAVATNTFALRQAIGLIGRYGLIEIGPEAFTMHRLVQAVVADELGPEERDANRRAAEALVVSARPDDGTEPSGWARWRQLMPHVLALDPGGATSDDVRYLACAAVWQLIARGDSGTAAPLAESLHVRWHEMSGPDDPYVLLAANNLAEIHRHLGRFELARQLDEDTLARRRRVLGPDDVHTLHSASNLATDLRQLGHLERARSLDEETLARRKRVLGENHPHSLSSATNLAMDLRCLGQAAEALRLDEMALAGHRQELGEDHPYTLGCANHLAADLALLGRVAEARGLNEATYVRYVAVLGEDHPETLHCATDIASNLRDLGLHEQARELDEQTLARYPAHGKDWPDALRATGNLAADLRALGRVTDARALDEEAYQGYQRMLGEDHPDTLRAALNLATDLRQLGLSQRAADLEQDTLARYRRTLGDDHPYTLSALDALSERPAPLDDQA